MAITRIMGAPFLPANRPHSNLASPITVARDISKGLVVFFVGAEKARLEQCFWESWLVREIIPKWA